MGPQVAFPILKVLPAAGILETPWRQPPVRRYSSTLPPTTTPMPASSFTLGSASLSATSKYFLLFSKPDHTFMSGWAIFGPLVLAG